MHTIEITADTYRKSEESCSRHPPNVHCYLGSSDEVLKGLLPRLSNKTALFYLDAHWEDHWPLRNELIEISKTHRDNCIIV